ncbi:hypothetical protein PoB_002065400 [Plakobranchus ocellatus]|uniref:Uncharacterized protein n=1 Tax=Plakobranchus ocellatus TaxID=259542 RepID=A0AAV3ZJT4_9GAST|nr:hypothetical protein PoB_002065400 [Plakobranchus ocellatus]
MTLHKKKYRERRQKHKQDSAMDDKLVMSADLQKVVMLIRMKSVYLTCRLTSLMRHNMLQSPEMAEFHRFVERRQFMGRDEVITSTFYRFLMEVRDEIEIVL